jgi:uncharacterized repeat protein (TIGR01451 family)
LLRALFVCSLLVSLPVFAQSADQEVLSAVDSPDPVLPGNNITYTIQIRNNGPDPAVNGGLNGNISGALTFVSAMGPAGFSCFNLGNNLSCTNPSFAAGTTATFTVVAQAGAHLANFPDTSVTSNFFTSGVTTDPNAGNNFTSVTTSVDSPQIDLSLTVTDSPDPVFPDGNITYTIPVTNSGPDNATSVNFNVFNNGTLQFQSATTPPGWNCTLPAVGGNPTFTCSTPSFAPSTVNFTVVVKAEQDILGLNDGTVGTVFGVNGTGDDTNDNNNSETENTAYVTPDADMTVSVTDSPDPVFPDGNITYTVNVGNNGPDAAPNARLNLFNNGSLQFQSVTPPAGWNCAAPAVNATPTFTCTTASFPSGGAVVFTVVVQADATINGLNDHTVSTNFSVGSDVADPNNANTSETEDTAYTAPDADMTVSVSDSPDPVFPDGNITYTVNVGNSGPDTAPNARLNLFNNGSLQFQSVTPPAGWNCAAPAVDAAPTFTCTTASFPSGGAVVFTVVVQADATINGLNDHTVSTNFSVGSDVADPVNVNSSETEDTAYVTPDADISVTNSDSPDPVSPGATITYTQSITNNGPDAAPNATFSQILPASVGFQSLSAVAGWTCGTPAIGASGAINCSNPSFASGATANFTLVVTVIANSGIVTDTVTGGSSIQDPDNTDNSATVNTTILAPVLADLGISKTTTSDGAAAGSSIAYTITLTNNGPDAAANVVVTDTLAAELLFQSISVPAGFNCTTPAVGANGTITCTAASMASGTTVMFTLVVQLTSNAVGPINNNATATSDGDDNNGANDNGNAAVVPVSAGNTADLGVVKSTQTTTAAPGDPVTYTITVTNNGPGTANEVIVNDPLPASLLFQSITPAATFTCTTPAVGASGTITCIGGPLANGATATFTLVTTISGSATGSIANGVIVSTSDSDPVSSNSAGASAPVVVATADLSITKTTASTQATSGSTINYTITVTNNGPDAATNVVVTDNLPTGLQFVSAIPSQGSCAGTDPFTCTLGTLNSGASATITLQTLVTATSGTISNTATVTADTDDGNAANNGSTTTPIPVVPGAAEIQGIPTLSEWALLALMAMLGVAAVVRMRM